MNPLPALVIVGMHRSGTSLVAQACSAAGISAGPPEEMLAAQSDNPAGFFEHRNLVALNDDLLESSGASWFAPGRVIQRDVPLPDAGLKLLEHLRASGNGQFLLKDPRLCLTWPVWEDQIEDPTLLYVYRDALSVARSLNRRNHFPLQLGLLLWEDYNRRALRYLADATGSTLAVSYDSILESPKVLRTTLEALQAGGFRCDPSAAESVVNSELRHVRRRDDDPLRALLSPAQRDLEVTCSSVCENGTLRPVDPLDSMSQARLADLSAVLAPLATVVETGLERDEAKDLCTERTAERDRALSQLKSVERDQAALTSAHEREITQHAYAAETLKALEGDHNRLARAHEREVTEHRGLASRHSKLTVAHGALEDKADYLFFSLTEAYRGLLTFENSTLAGLQRMLRQTYRLLTRQRGRNSRYEDILEYAHQYFDEFDIEKPIAPPKKTDMLGDVVRYVWRNPAGSVRSFSWQRLKRALGVFFGSSPADLAVWVDARFPASSSGRGNGFDPTTLDASLDTLELHFDAPAQPRVSIVIPVFNDYRVTLNCLRSLKEHAGETPFEIVIADDCSTDLTTSIAERIRGITLCRTPRNVRFLRNCNLAAKDVSGEFIVFLNNDTEVTEGWLEALLEPFADPSVGVVGPKLLFADGKLQEAGGIVWKDASAWNFGRSDDPEKPAYCYRREVDYVSGACLMVRLSLWQQLGGFDEIFVPAYYEDADFCFAARDAGMRVVYEPQSTVYHYEGVSNGTDLASGVKQHQVSNQAVFRNKWHAILDREHFANAEHVVWARDRSSARPRVLVIDHYVPQYDKDAGGRSTYQYLQLLLRMGCHVQFMGANFFPHQPYTRQLQAMGVEVLVGESIARGLDSWLSEQAAYLDEIIVHRPHVAEQFLPHLERLQPRVPISFFGMDLHYLRIEREAVLKHSEELRREAADWRQRELAVCARVDRVYYFSQHELDELSTQVDASKLRCIPLYAMQLGELPLYAPRDEYGILFVGGYNHPPNVDAAVWLCNDILPVLRDYIPGARVHLVGSNAPEQVRQLASDSVQVHGYLSDEVLNSLYRRVGVAVVPLRYGAGIKGKVIEAIAQNVPLVTTDIGAEGIPDAEAVMWIENTAEGLAKRLADILGESVDVSGRMSHYPAWLAQHFAAERACDVLRADMPSLAGGEVLR